MSQLLKTKEEEEEEKNRRLHMLYGVFSPPNIIQHWANPQSAQSAQGSCLLVAAPERVHTTGTCIIQPQVPTWTPGLTHIDGAGYRGGRALKPLTDTCSCGAHYNYNAVAG